MDYKLQQFDLLKTVGKGNFCFNENVLLIFYVFQERSEVFV